MAKAKEKVVTEEVEEKVEIEVVKEKLNKDGIPVGRPLTEEEIKRAMARK